MNFVASLSDNALATWVAKSPKPVRKVRTNAAPSIAPIDDMPPSFLGLLTADQIEAASERIRDDDELRQRIIDAVISGRGEYEDSPHIEEQIYAGFIPDDDKARMETFHLVPWQNRVVIVDALEDERLRYYGYRLIHERHPEFLSAEIREFYRTHDSGRLMDASGTAKWNTLLVALAAIGGTRVGCSEEQSQMLDEYEAYLQARIAAGG